MADKIVERIELCVRCKKNKATLTYCNSPLDYAHGFTERICQECYDKQARESEWYKLGVKETEARINEEIRIARQCTDFKCVFCSNKDCKNEHCVLNKKWDGEEFTSKIKFNQIKKPWDDVKEINRRLGKTRGLIKSNKIKKEKE